MATLNGRFICQQCDSTEDKCDCVKYCCLCNAVEGIRLCADGLMYCQPCREACDHDVEVRL